MSGPLGHQEPAVPRAPQIREVTGQDAQVEAVLARHHALMRATSPEESCHVMSADALRASGARVFALEMPGGEVCAVGALKPFGSDAVELKSMHTLDRWRGQGLGAVLLDHLLAEARNGGAGSAWLETGATDEFIPARRLYEAAGFQTCAPFGDYIEDPLSLFMTTQL
jgi:putative acetyltransferase